MNKKYHHIHFICTGNAYRSRLAEAYAKSRKPENITFSSSGIEAHKNENGIISWCAQRLIKKHKLIPFAAPMWTQTTLQHIENATLIIFMHPIHYEKTKAIVGYDGANHLVWNIPDVHEQGFNGWDGNIDQEPLLLRTTENTFDTIRQNVDELLALLENPEEE